MLVNDAGFTGQTNNAGQLITCKERIKEMNEIHLKFVDDLTIAESIDMTNQLRSIPVSQRPQPDCFRARTGHELINESSKVYTQLQNIQAYADTNKMKLNIDKTKLMLFNTCKNKDFIPNFELGSIKLDLVEKAKLLGVIVSSDLSWEENTAYIVKRCNQKIWIIKPLKKLGARISDRSGVLLNMQYQFGIQHLLAFRSIKLKEFRKQLFMLSLEITTHLILNH